MRCGRQVLWQRMSLLTFQTYPIFERLCQDRVQGRWNFIEAIADFDDSEFSKCEIEIMDYVLVRYGNMTASDLFLETCKKDSLWYRAAVRTGLLETFNRQECNNSDLQINFAEVMSDSSAEVYCESLNIRQTANLLNVEFYV